MAKILVVDDDKLMLKLVQVTLVKARHEVTVAEDGYRAVECLATETFQLIEKSDVILALKLGIDDYVVKPIDPTQFVTKVDALLLRKSNTVAPAKKEQKLSEASLLTLDAEVVGLTEAEITFCTSSGQYCAASKADYKKAS